MLGAPGTVPAFGAIERVAAAAPDRVSEAIVTPSGRLLVTLRNNAPAGQPGSDTPVQLRAHPMFSPLMPGDGVAAHWRRLDTGRGPDTDGRFQLARGEAATFEVRGTFATAGSWETAIEALDAAGNIASRIVLAISRTVPPPPPVPATLLADPRPARIGLHALEAWTGTGHAVRLQARNAGTETLPLRGANIGEVTTLAGEAELAAALANGFSVGKEGCVGPLGAGETCTVVLDVPPGLAPGRYVVEVVLSGEGAGQSLRAQTIEVRAWRGSESASFGSHGRTKSAGL